jgi:hypothetical protein
MKKGFHGIGVFRIVVASSPERLATLMKDIAPAATFSVPTPAHLQRFLIEKNTKPPIPTFWSFHRKIIAETPDLFPDQQNSPGKAAFRYSLTAKTSSLTLVANPTIL